jgi:hypothetical protein
MRRPPIITLTTDFGTADHYVGTMKGVILGIAPQARVVDISHEIRPFQIAEGAYVIAQACRYFPPKTIHVVVVDPGVGSARRPILAEIGGQYFVAPDNGVLSMVLEQPLATRAAPKQRSDRAATRRSGQPASAIVRHITAERYFLQPLSHTFHGRDVFSSVAAHMARGVPPGRFGRRIADYARLDFFRPTRTGKRFRTGLVLHIDRFGNLITNFHVGEFPDLPTRPFELNIGLHKLTRLVSNFTEAQPGELVAIIGSSGYIEVVANQASAAKLLGCEIGSPAELVLY